MGIKTQWSFIVDVVIDHAFDVVSGKSHGICGRDERYWRYALCTIDLNDGVRKK